MHKLLPVLLAISPMAFAQNKSIDAIYGEDNRHDLYSYSKPEIVQLARSTVALVKTDRFEVIGDILKMAEESFESTLNVCPSERFKDQPATAFCSGFLVAPNKIVTAGHCVRNNAACRTTSFVFDYAMTDAHSANTIFSKNQVYGCSKILGRKYDSGIDYAIVELDRKVLGRVPLKLSNNKSLQASDKVFVIGHPSGLPTKITDNAKVRKVYPYLGYFTVNSDTFGGNSGSAVFNEKTREVEGILVRGETDFRTTSDLCKVSQDFGEDAGQGEDAVFISNLEESYSEISEPEIPTGLRYVWISYSGCIEFLGTNYNRRVEASMCADAPAPEYKWDDYAKICREYRGSFFIQEVASNLCPESIPLRYEWKKFYTKCAEYRGETFIRYTERRFCRRP